MPSQKILVCLDTDPQPSVFDGVVAVDAGVDHLFRHGNVSPDQVRDLVYGVMFTRGGDNLKNSAIFIGGSDVRAGEVLVEQAKQCFFGPVRVSIMLDSNGSNTTAAAAVLSAGKHVQFTPETIGVVLGTGPVGQRAIRLLASEGVQVRVASRNTERAQEICDDITAILPDAKLTACCSTGDAINETLAGASLLIAGGPPGIELVSESVLQAASTLQVAVDLNAVPPVGIAGIKPQDAAVERNGVIGYGALGVGGLKMKIHRQAIAQLFESTDAVLDAEEIYQLGKSL